MFRDFGEHSLKVGTGHVCAGRIVGVREEEEFRFRADRVDHRGDIPGDVIRQRDRGVVKRARDAAQLVTDEARVSEDDVVAGICECLADQIDEFIRAIADNNFIEPDSKVGRKIGA